MHFAASKVGLPGDDHAVAALAPVFAQVGDAVAVGVTGAADAGGGPWVDGERRVLSGALELAKLERSLVRLNRRWSFSAISDRARSAVLDPEDESLGDAGAADEPVEMDDTVPVNSLAPSSDLPLGAVAGGARSSAPLSTRCSSGSTSWRPTLTPSCHPHR